VACWPEVISQLPRAGALLGILVSTAPFDRMAISFPQRNRHGHLHRIE
jgi:hypothetical protein